MTKKAHRWFDVTFIGKPASKRCGDCGIDISNEQQPCKPPVQLGYYEPTVKDPFFEWCDAHRDDMQKFPDSYVAIDLKDGIVAAAKTDPEFSKKLKELGDDKVSSLFLTHTSLYV